MHTAANVHPRVMEWQKRQAVIVTAFLLFETLTGLSIYFLPFSVTNQVLVLVHTGVGLVFLIPYFAYQLRHWRLYREGRMTHVQLTGYFSLVATLVAVVSGLVLTYQAVLGTRISYGWDLVHLISTFAVIAAVLPHILIIVLRNLAASSREAIQPILNAQRRFGRSTGAVTLGFFALAVVGVYAYRPVELTNRLPDDYNFLYGADQPFAPSLARTTTGQAFDPRSLGGSESCGTAGCHTEIVKEWAVSAHRYSAMDPGFRAIQKVMGQQNGAESTRYCGGCHDPISLFAGTKNLFQDELTSPIGLDEGVSCIVCHAIQETDVKGNAAFVIAQPERYMFELHEGRTARFLRDFLIRAYPRHHVESLQHRRFKSPEFCAACHKQFIDEEINNVGWVQLQNQYDNWRTSRWNEEGDATRTVECRECHMPLIDSSDPARGDQLDYNRTATDGKHRSHRFLGANQFIPALLDLPGGAEHIELTEKWLRGEIEIPEIAHKWRTGPAVPIELVSPEEVPAGQDVRFAVVIANNKVGHDFPTGPLDIIQSWLEVVVTDGAGNQIFASGATDERRFIEPGAFMFKAEPVDQYGKLIDRHNLWDMVGVRFRRALYPGMTDRADFAFQHRAAGPARRAPIPERQDFSVTAPADGSTLHVRANLQYRKINQFLLNELLGEESGMTAPITTISTAERTIRIVPSGRSAGS
jgi:hypothetical protein